VFAVARESGFATLALAPGVCASSHRLPRRHKDPFGRRLVWQAIQSGTTLLSQDKTLAVYVPDGLRLVGTSPGNGALD
jgi:PIN domain nuclease of toxin-antitoxin system